MLYKIGEIFESIQGAGVTLGTPMVFLRFVGCNLACSFCDEPDWLRGAQQKPYMELNLDDLLFRVAQFPPHLPIVLTGGEPCLQLDAELVRQLAKVRPVYLETNGTVHLERAVWEPMSIVSTSPKRAHVADWLLERANCVKLLVPSPFNIEGVALQFGSQAQIIVQPVNTVDGHLIPDNLEKARTIAAAHPGWKMIPQMHTLFGWR